MKRSFAILASIAIIFVSLSFVFRWLHFPGAALLAIPGGLVGLAAVVVLMLYWLKQPGCKVTKWITGITLALTIVAVVFKRMYFPGGTLLCVIDFGIMIPLTTILQTICLCRQEE